MGSTISWFFILFQWLIGTSRSRPEADTDPELERDGHWRDDLDAFCGVASGGEHPWPWLN
jgi:hypothetical protein